MVATQRVEDCLSAINKLPHFPIHTSAYIDYDVLDVIAIEVTIGVVAFDETIDAGLPAL